MGMAAGIFLRSVRYPLPRTCGWAGAGGRGSARLQVCKRGHFTPYAGSLAEAQKSRAPARAHPQVGVAWAGPVPPRRRALHRPALVLWHLARALPRQRRAHRRHLLCADGRALGLLPAPALVGAGPAGERVQELGVCCQVAVACGEGRRRAGGKGESGSEPSLKLRQRSPPGAAPCLSSRRPVGGGAHRAWRPGARRRSRRPRPPRRGGPGSGG